MNVIKYPSPETWKQLSLRPQLDLGYLEGVVNNILNRVKISGDAALKEFTLQLDKVRIEKLRVSKEEIDKASTEINDDLKKAIQIAADNIRKFHDAQRREVLFIETMPGVLCWRKSIAIEKVGIYIPGGTAPLFSTVLMLGIPAQLAGCKEVILCSPPGKGGKIEATILYAAQLAGISTIFKVGGAQAIAALAFGTESIPAVNKVFGPGNQYVTCAKQLISQQGTAIDMPAGPSEVMVIADENGDPAFIAADLLSQAEHGSDSQVMLITRSESLINAVQREIDKQLVTLPRKDVASQSLDHSRVILFSSDDELMNFVNEYAPEHLIINTVNCEQLADKVINAGSVFLGSYTPESAGDYASGTNHTLPTNGFAKAYSGVSLESFCKFVTFQKISEAGIRNLGPVVEKMAMAEKLEGHAEAVRIRLKSGKELEERSK